MGAMVLVVVAETTEQRNWMTVAVAVIEKMVH